MKPQFQHQVVTSFMLWLDHIILSRGQAYQNIDSSFYYQNDDRLDENYVAFASPHKQWVADSSISGANVIKGIVLDGYYIERGKQGVRYDFENGRVLIPRVLANQTSNVEGVYSVKDFNTYITDQTEEELLIETKFDKNSRFDQDIFEGIKAYDQVVPAIFTSYEQGENIPFAFGGQDITESKIRCVVFAENSYQLDGIFSILKDLNLSTIANVGFNEHPLNEFGDLKYGIYDYKDLSDRYYNFQNSDSFFYLDRVTVSKLNDRVAKRSHPGLYIGFIDFNIRAHRYPRAPLAEPVASRAPKTGYAPLSPYQLSIEAMQAPLPPFSLNVHNGYPNAPRNLFLTTVEHIRMMAGEIASLTILQGGQIKIKLEGAVGQVAYLSIMGQIIKIGSDANDNLIFDNHTFTAVGETITRNITGVNFDITWDGRGSQIFTITRKDGTSTTEFQVAVYVPCD
jgi:hypothetical protein